MLFNLIVKLKGIKDPVIKSYDLYDDNDMDDLNDWLNDFKNNKNSVIESLTLTNKKYL